MKGLCKSKFLGVKTIVSELTGMKCLLTHYDCLFSGCFVPCFMNIHRILKHLRLRRAEFILYSI